MCHCTSLVRILFSVLIFVFFTQTLYSQNDNAKGYSHDALNGMVFLHVTLPSYGDNSNLDIYGYGREFISSLNSVKNLPKLLSSDDILKLNTIDRCKVGYITLDHYGGTAAVNIRDCKNQVIWATSDEGKNNWSYYDRDLKRAFKNCFKDLKKLSWKYDSKLTPTLDFIEVDRTNLSKDQIVEYLDQNESKLDKIEGIYQTMDNGYAQQPLYELAVIFNGFEYEVIILEDIQSWTAGDIKAYLEETAAKNVYTGKWIGAQKLNEDIRFLSISDNGLILQFELNKVETEAGVITTSFLKKYPNNNKISIGNTIASKGTSSGTGFVIDPSGYIVTNAHVVGQNSGKLTVKFRYKDKVYPYKAILIKKDNSNDIAILKIEDDSFRSLGILPYSFCKKAEDAEEVFTVGYPLENILGEDPKTTNGIISSQSGYQGNPTYFQITVPLHPGNSGGPLLNKKGEIIGITSSGLKKDKFDNVNYAIKIAYIEPLISQTEINKINFTEKLNQKEMQTIVKDIKRYICVVEVSN